jgi:DNA-binding LacI/PurR family transcriptional regulator
VIDHSSPVPLYQQVEAELRRQIVAGELAVGSKLPTHRELAIAFDVSIITINKALSGLVSEGVLYSRVGRGTFVAVRPASNDRHRTPVFGFVLRDLNSAFFSLVAHAAQQRADALGIGLLFSSTSHHVDREEEQIQRFRDLGVHGLIIVSMSRTYRISQPIRALHDAGFPYVMVSYTEGDEVPFIGSDLDMSGYLAGQHLIALGKRRLGYVGAKLGSSLFEVKFGGFRRAAREHGLSIDSQFVFEYPFDGEWNDYRSGYAIGERLASMTDRPEAMFAFNDLGALGLEDALLDRGLRVPDDVAIVGLDDVELAERARVPLTTVRQPSDRIGALAVDTLLARVRGEQPPPPVRQLFTPELVIRSSCGAGGVRADIASQPSRSFSRPHEPRVSLVPGEQ